MEAGVTHFLHPDTLYPIFPHIINYQGLLISPLGFPQISCFSSSSLLLFCLSHHHHTLCDPIDGSPPGPPSLGFSRREHWSGLPFPSPMREKWKGSRSVVSDSYDPMDCSPPGSSVHGILQARDLAWVPLPSHSNTSQDANLFQAAKCVMPACTSLHLCFVWLQIVSHLLLHYRTLTAIHFQSQLFQPHLSIPALFPMAPLLFQQRHCLFDFIFLTKL